MNYLHEILKLPVQDRIHLVQTIWDSILNDNEQEISISEEHKKLIDERLAAHEQNPEDVISWEEAKERIKKRI